MTSAQRWKVQLRAARAGDITANRLRMAKLDRVSWSRRGRQVLITVIVEAADQADAEAQALTMLDQARINATVSNTRALDSPN